MKWIMIATLTLFASACALRPEAAGTDPVTKAYTSGGGVWDSGGGITAVTRVFGKEGQTIVCGVWMTDRQSALSVNNNEEVMSAAAVFAGPTRIVNNLEFMRRVSYRDRLTGETAQCVASDIPWSAEFAQAPVAMRFPRVTFEDGRRRGTGSVSVIKTGDRVTFRESPRPDPLGKAQG